MNTVKTKPVGTVLTSGSMSWTFLAEPYFSHMHPRNGRLYKVRALASAIGTYPAKEVTLVLTHEDAEA